MQVVDLFCGCGGMSLGFQQAGFEIIAACDNWSPAVEVYQKNFAHSVYLDDLSLVKNLQKFICLQPEMIIGGPPCQDFSSAGKRDDGGERADLTITFAEIVANTRPKWVVMENVDRVMKSQVLREAKNILGESGYGLTEAVLNASFYGVPQNRKRYFLIGEIDGQNGALSHYLIRKSARKPMSVHDYLGNALGIEHYYRHPRSYQRRAIFSIYEPSPTVRGVNRPIPGTYKGHPGDTAPVTSDLRPLTTLERSYIQTFPVDFVFEGAKTDLEQMIGNAVPINLARAVAESILDYVRDRQAGITVSPESIHQPRLF